MDVTNRLPATGAGFVWENGPMPILRPQTDAAVAAYTTRIGGTSSGPFAALNLSFAVGDDREAVRANRATAGAAIDSDGRHDGRWSVTKQVHGCDVVPAERGGLPEADGLHTADRRETVAVLSADCVLLLFCGPRGIAVAHAGWRGLIAGVVENAIASVGATEVFAGPAIGPCCFEVGPEVIEAFTARAPASVVDERHVDLWTAAAQAAAGTAFASARICTSCHAELFFSHRRDAGRTGRQALLARMAAR